MHLFREKKIFMYGNHTWKSSSTRHKEREAPEAKDKEQQMKALPSGWVLLSAPFSGPEACFSH